LFTRELSWSCALDAPFQCYPQDVSDLVGILCLLKQQVVVSAAYSDLERPILVLLDASDTCAQFGQQQVICTQSRKAARRPRTCRVRLVHQTRSLAPERSLRGSRAVAKHAELRMVLCRLRNVHVGDASNRTAQDACADAQLRMTQEDQGSLLGLISALPALILSERRATKTKQCSKEKLTRSQRPSVWLVQSKRLGHAHVERDRPAHSSLAR
jgi:hypothetical protein